MSAAPEMPQNESPPQNRAFDCVRPLSTGADDLQSAADMAREWGETPFDEARARAHFAARKKGQTALLALRDGEPAGLLFAEPCGLWTDSQSFAFAPMVWTRGVGANGAQVPSSVRESAALALTREFLERAKEDEMHSARLVFRAGMLPNPSALAAMGLSPHSRIFIRRASLPGDQVSGRVRWFSTEERSARGQEMNLPVEKMFPELFADAREAPPEARRLESADLSARWRLFARRGGRGICTFRRTVFGGCFGMQFRGATVARWRRRTKRRGTGGCPAW